MMRKRLAAKVLLWACLAAVALPISILVFGFWWYRNVRTEPMAGWGFAMTIQFWCPVPLFGLFGLVLALEWKQGLQKRIKQLQDERMKDAI